LSFYLVKLVMKEQTDLEFHQGALGLMTIVIV
jgi:hypothetical protein